MPLQVSVVTPDRELWSGEADFLIARSDGGDIGVLPGHAPFLGALSHSRLVIQTADAQTYAAVHGGFLEVFEGQVTILAERAELAEEIDLSRAQAQKDEAERRIAESDTPENRAKLMRNANRLRTAAEAGLLNT
ncbi:MAG TPA: F0F1 ATP synthase subunit epsilon [Actinomycetota bacterium]|nr:F0F1 ATP synthase subunit epsilon [Actinomycetota bacterium]